jgi:hypothetical protein
MKYIEMMIACSLGVEGMLKIRLFFLVVNIGGTAKYRPMTA